MKSVAVSRRVHPANVKQLNEYNRIYPGAICLVRHVDAVAVSIAVRGNNRGSFPNRVVPKDIFGVNFEPRKGGTKYTGLAPGRHFTEKYT